MSNNFVFGGINVASKKQSLNLRIIDNPVIVDRSDAVSPYDFIPIILTDEYYEGVQVDAIEKFLREAGLHKYKIISALNCKISKDQIKTEQKTGVIEFYEINSSNFEDYIPSHAPIVTVGAALYSLLKEDDIYPNHVQQIIFGKSRFWFSKDLTSKNCHAVFPIESFRDIFAKGFKKPVDSFKTKLAQIQLNTVIKFGNKPVPRYPKLKKHFIQSEEEFNTIFYEPNKDRRNDYLAWDLETSGLDFTRDEIGCITLSYDGIEGYYIPWKYVDKEKLNEILGHSKQIGANLKFDVKYLWKAGIPNARIDEDICTIGHVLDETRSNSLKAMAFYYSEYGGYERPLDEYKKKTKIKSYLNIPEEILREYAIMDAIVTYRVWVNAMAHMRDLDKRYPNERYAYAHTNMESYYYTRRIPANNLYARMEYQGIYIDKPRLDALRVRMQDYANGLKSQLSEAFHVSKDFEWTSSKEVGKLFERVGWEELGRQKSGEYNVGEFQLTRWGKDHPEAKIYQTLKSVLTMMNAFVGDDAQTDMITSYLSDKYDDGSYIDDEEGTKGWSQYLRYHPEDNSYRMHADFFPMGTESGRSRCQRPNLQNTPTRGLFAKDIKRCVCTPDDENYYIATVDYSSLQMRLATQHSKDKNLTEVFNSVGADAHSRTGWLVFCGDKEFEVENVEVEQNGKIYHYLGGEQVMTQRGYVLARDLKETDELINVK